MPRRRAPIGTSTLRLPRSPRGGAPACRMGRCAAAATELAITLPVLLLLTLGCVELGRGVALYSIVSEAARAGADYASTHGYTTYNYASWQKQIIQEVKNEVQGNHPLDPNGLSVTVTTVAEPGGFNLTTVTANYQFDTITQWPGLPNNFVVTHSVSMRRYQ